MGKNKKKSKATKKPDSVETTAAESVVGDSKTNKQPRISMQDLEAMSDSDDGSLPPEEEWNAEAKNLRDAIMSGEFDHVLEREDGDASSVEEVNLDDGDDKDQSDDDNDEEAAEANADEDAESGFPEEDEESVAESDDEGEEVEVPVKKGKEAKRSVKESLPNESSDDGASVPGEDEDSEFETQKITTKTLTVDSVEEDGDGGDDELMEDASDDEEAEEKTTEQKNQINSKALHVVTRELTVQKEGWSWPETFDIMPATPLPFDKKADPENHVDIHDDLKREVSFYDNALEAVNEARLKCRDHSIPFTRPDDFFAEMIKTDDHMAKIKDRLIFENKKMDAVAMRKSNKEQKLRVKESQTNRAAEKSKRKREHFKSLDDWQASGAAGSRNDGALMDALDGKGPNKKRMYADKKYGFGGQKPRFKQNDRKDLNDTSKFNPRGNFPGGMKRTASSKGGGNRPGKRARDAKRK